MQNFVLSGEILDALGKIKSVLGNDLDHIALNFNEGKCSISAESATIAIQFNIKSESDDGSFNIPAKSLEHLSAKRGKLMLRLKDDKLRFKEGSYKGMISVFPYTEIEVESSESENTIKIPAKSGINKHFNFARKHLALEELAFSKDSSQSFMVKVEDSSMACGTFDRVHAGIYMTDVEWKKKLNFSITYEALKKVMALTSGESFDLALDDSSLYISTKSLKASLRMMQANIKSFDHIIGMFDGGNEDIIAKCKVKSSLLTGFMDNMLSITEKDQPLVIDIRQGEMKMEYSTALGKVEELIQCKTKNTGKAHVFPETMRDFIRVVPSGEVVLKICGINDKSVFLVESTNNNLSYMTSIMTMNEPKDEEDE